MGFTSIAFLLSACVPPEIPHPAITHKPGQVSQQGELHADIEWDEDTIKHVDVLTDMGGLLPYSQQAFISL